MTTNEGEGQRLIQAIARNPDADGPRLAYADWIEQNGDPVRARFIRVQCDLEALQAEQVIGYVKTQHRPVLEPEQHARVGELGTAQRSSIFTWAHRFGCYLRMTRRSPGQHPWFAVVRLEVPECLGFERARARLEEVAGSLPRFAGVPHADPRAPQNLQAIAGLEKELRRRCGDRGLGLRAIRAALGRV